jgi:hypothetical protein
LCLSETERDKYDFSTYLSQEVAEKVASQIEQDYNSKAALILVVMHN